MSPPPAPITPEQEIAASRDRERKLRALSLLTDENFVYFLEHVLEDEMNQATVKLRSLLSSDQERDRAAHVYAAMERVKDWARANAPS